MGRWRRDAQEVVDDLVKQRSSSEGEPGLGELTLSAEGRSLHANTSLLLAASPYLRRTLIKGGSGYPGQCGCGPKLAIIVLVGVAFTALQSLISYLYGEDVIIEDEDEEQKFLEAAKALEIIGLVNQVQDQNETVLVSEGTTNFNVTVVKDSKPTTTSPSILEDKKAVEPENIVHAKPKAETEAIKSNLNEQRLSVKPNSLLPVEKKWIRPVTPPRKSGLFGAGGKKYSRQMTLPSMAKRRSVKEVVDLASSEVFNGGVRKIKNNPSPSSNMPPPKLPSSKRKSDELESNTSNNDSRKINTSASSNSDTTDDDFKNSSADLFDADATMFTSPIQSPQITPAGVNKRSKWEDLKSVTNVVDDEVSIGENSDVLNDLNEKLSPLVVRRKPLSPLNKTDDELRNSKSTSSSDVKKKLFAAAEKKANLTATQQIVKDFNKIPERVREDRGEKSRPTKEEKAQMDGWACPECENWYKGLESQMHPREVERLRQQCSKHRKEKDYQPPPSTPPDFWNTSMPSTAEAYRTGLLQVLPESYEDSFFLKD